MVSPFTDDVPIHGVFVAVAGPSGAGKDTLIEYARRHFTGQGDIVFVRRLITREADAASEDHDTLSIEAFERARSEGAFACSWEANGLGYALPAGADEAIASGCIAVANVSRAAIPLLRERYRNVLTVIVTARANILAERLAARGRETEVDIRERLARNATYAEPGEETDTITIDNSGTAEEGGRRMVAALEKALAWSALSDAV
jgi:ribose 1,5-bisphosphokinase